MNGLDQIHTTTELAAGSDQAFITLNNFKSFKSIVFETDYSRDCRDLEDLYKSKLSHILSRPELALLRSYKAILESSPLKLESYKPISEKADTKTFVWEGRPPAYHSKPSCEKLRSDYQNFEIPPEIRDKGDSEIAKFRKFFSEHRSLIKDDENKFIDKLEAVFFLKNRPISIFANNSGWLATDNIDLEDLENTIDLLLHDAEEFRNKDEVTKLKIRNLGYGTHRQKEAKEKGTILYIWHHEYKQELKNLLTHYFRVKFNPDLVFSGLLLDTLGFKRCGHCHN